MSAPESVQEPRWCPRWLLVVVGLCLLLPLIAAEPPKAKMSATELQEKVRERNRLWTETHKLRAAGKLTEGITAAEKMLAIERQLFGDRADDVVGSLQWLAQLHEQREDFMAAGKRLREVLDIQMARYGKDDWRVTDARLALTDVQLRAKLDEKQRKQLAEANRLNQQRIALYRKGASREAIPLAKRVGLLRKQVLGDKHPDYAYSLNSLAEMYRAMGDYAKAEPLYRQAMEITRQSLQLTASVQSERQQLRMGDDLRHRLDSYLSAVVQAQAKAKLPSDTSLPTLYGHVLAWKGAVFMQQRRQRLARSQPELKDRFTKWESVCSRLATRALAVPTPAQHDAWQRDLVRLTEEKEDLEVELAQKSVAFRRQQQAQTRTLADVQKVLPADAALIDFLQYTHFESYSKTKGKWIVERRLIAFVVRPDRKLEMVQLGAVKPLAEAIDKWRQSYGQYGWRPNVEAAKLLREKLWLPLERHLKGANTVLVSPDGVLGKLPLTALPGDKPGSYLIETWNLTIVPVPQRLPELLASPDKADAVAPPSLLLVGDVDYGAAPGRANLVASRSAPAGGCGWNMHGWRPLPGTTKEIAGIQASFQRAFAAAKSLPLPKGKATENAVRAAAPHYRYLHMATHGYFAPKELRSALSPQLKGNDPLALGGDLLSRRGVVGHHPGLLSGVVLAGANRSAQEGEDDGILTATEVATLDLSGVETVVLSACETGLGEVAGGEGLLGLQRAFQESGAHTAVTSLWQVPDSATRVLMERFYDNLWRKKMGRLAALREAQLWLLREGRRQPQLLRGLKLIRDEAGDAAASRLPPYYWAAFVLSGDWR